MANVRSLMNHRMPVKYTSDVPPMRRMASSLLAAISCRARSWRSCRSAALIGLASALRDFNLAIGSGSDLLAASPCAAVSALPVWVKATVAATPADCKKLRREDFISGSAPGLGECIEYHSSRVGTNLVSAFLTADRK